MDKDIAQSLIEILRIKWDARAFVISKRGQAPDQIIEGERIQVPTFEVVSYPQVRFSQVKERRFNVIDRAQQRAKSNYSRK